MQGLDGPAFKVGPYCSVPGCHKISEHAHHIVRRSFLPGDFQDWVRMPDGVEVGNLTGMCVNHHQMVTENVAAITYDNGVFYWSMGGAAINVLAYQPPKMGDTSEADVHTREQKPVCPGCGRALPKPKIETATEEKKNRATWAISVPADERENGYEVLDTLLEEVRDELDKAGLHYDKGNKVRYYPLATALALFVQNADRILSDE
jgi:hypothetical protein